METAPASRVSTPPARVAAGGPGDTRVGVLAWCLWLLGTWSVSLIIDSTVPAVRMMVFLSLIGLLAIWPAMRLGQIKTAAPARGGADVLVEWVCLILVFQAVVWPLRISMNWSVAQTVWLDAGIAAWSALTALVIAWGRWWHTSSSRTVAMFVCVALLLAEPVVMALSRAHWTLRVSPLQTISALSVEGKVFVPEPWITHVSVAAAAALVGWLLFVVTTLVRGR